MEIRLKHYNSNLKIGLNDWKEVYDNNNGKWLPAKEHCGRLVYGNNRISYFLIKEGLDKKDFIISLIDKNR